MAGGKEGRKARPANAVDADRTRDASIADWNVH